LLNRQVLACCKWPLRELTVACSFSFSTFPLWHAEKEIEQLKLEKINRNKKDIDMALIMENVGYFLEHLEELISGSSDPLKRAAYFGLIFDKAPTYLDLTSGTAKLATFIELKKGVAPLSIPDGG
jgi:hypothetical protein